MDNYFNYVINLISRVSGVDTEEIKEDSYFDADLNIGEMEFIEMLTELEDEFHVELIETKDDYDTVQDLVEAISEQVE